MNWKSLIVAGLVFCGIINSTLAHSGSNYQSFARGIAVSTNCIIFYDSVGNRSGIIFSDGTQLFTFPTNFPSVTTTNLYVTNIYFPDGTTLWTFPTNFPSVTTTNLYVTNLYFPDGTSLSTAPNITITNIYNNLFVTNIIYTNMDAYVSYMGYPRLSISSITKHAGSGHHPTTYSHMIDTNLTTYIGGTNDAGDRACYYANLGAIYDGYVVAVVSGYDFGDSGTANWLYGSVFYSTNVPTFEVTTARVNNSSIISHQIEGMLSYTKHFMIKEFHGQYVGIQMFNGNSTSDGGYRIYELMIFGITNVWRNW